MENDKGHLTGNDKRAGLGRTILSCLGEGAVLVIIVLLAGKLLGWY